MKKRLKFAFPIIILLIFFFACNKDSNEDPRSNSKKIIGTWVIEKTETYSMKNGKFEKTKTVNHKSNNSRVNFVSDSIIIYKGNDIKKFKIDHLSGTWSLEQEKKLTVKGLNPEIIQEKGSDIFVQLLYVFPQKSEIITIDDSKLILQSPNIYQPKSYLKTYLSK